MATVRQRDVKRRRGRGLRAAWAALGWLAAAGCGWTPADEQVLARFFERSRVYDRTMLAPIATTVFDPRVDGVVDRFDIVNRGPEQPLDGGGMARELTLNAVVRLAGQERERTLTVTLEWRGKGWVVTRVR